MLQILARWIKNCAGELRTKDKDHFILIDFKLHNISTKNSHFSTYLRHQKISSSQDAILSTIEDQCCLQAQNLGRTRQLVSPRY